jgi:hypothetical protein
VGVHRSAVGSGPRRGAIRDNPLVNLTRRAEVGPPDPRLDRFRRGVARASLHGEPVGRLWTRVQVWWTVEGHLWWRRGVDAREHLEWFFEFDQVAEGLPFVDFVAADDRASALMAEELERGVLSVNGTTYDLEWLSGDEALPAPDGYWDE